VLGDLLHVLGLAGRLGLDEPAHARERERPSAPGPGSGGPPSRRRRRAVARRARPARAPVARGHARVEADAQHVVRA
jgi:hypothetical protein